jgi:hypothetical protein
MIARDPYEDCKYRIGEMVVVPFDEMVALWLFDNENRYEDSISIRNQLIHEFDSVSVRAVITERFFIKEYGIGYYYIEVYDKQGNRKPTPIISTGVRKARFNAISEWKLKKVPISM